MSAPAIGSLAQRRDGEVALPALSLAVSRGLKVVAALVLEGTWVGEALAVEFRGSEGSDREGEGENESKSMLEMHSWCCMKRWNVLNLDSKATGVVFPIEKGSEGQ